DHRVAKDRARIGRDAGHAAGPHRLGDPAEHVAVAGVAPDRIGQVTVLSSPGHVHTRLGELDVHVHGFAFLSIHSWATRKATSTPSRVAWAMTPGSDSRVKRVSPRSPVWWSTRQIPASTMRRVSASQVHSNGRPSSRNRTIISPAW